MNNTKLIDGEALLDTFKLSNTTNFPIYIKSVWKDLSRRSDNCDKGFDKIVFSNYYELPGIISTRLFNLIDSDKDGYLNYNEFSKGMFTLFDSSIEKLMEFIFDLFDENNDGYISSEDVRTIFQYIPLQKKSFSNNSFKDRLESQEELHEIITSFFKLNEKIDLKEFKNLTQTENSTIFLYITIFLLTKKPFSDRTLQFFQKETKDKEKETNNDSQLHRSSTADKRSLLIASPNLTSKFSPSLRILNSPFMKKEKEEIKKEMIEKCNQKNLLQKNKTADYSINDDKKLFSIKSNDFVSLAKNNEQLYLNMIEERNNDKDLLHPTRLNMLVNDGFDIKDMKDLKDDLIDPEEFLDGLSSNIENEEEISHEGYILKLVDDKLKKLWFTLYEKYLYCK